MAHEFVNEPVAALRRARQARCTALLVDVAGLAINFDGAPERRRKPFCLVDVRLITERLPVACIHAPLDLDRIERTRRRRDAFVANYIAIDAHAGAAAGGRVGRIHAGRP